MKVIETLFDGIRFRSRTEARWAMFFNVAGLQYIYEPEGFVLPSGRYLPDFWLPDPITRSAGIWIEVKPGEPTSREYYLCAELNRASGALVLVAMGPPDPAAVGQFCECNLDNDGDRYSLVDDYETYGSVWCSGGVCDHRVLNKSKFIGQPSVIQAYQAARAARFEFDNDRGRKPITVNPYMPTRR